MSEQSTSTLIQVMAQRIAEAYEPPTGAGRVSDIADAAKVKVFLTALTEGCYRNTACSLADISKQTLSNWTRKAGEGNKAAQLFVDAVEKAEAWAERELVADVRRAGKKEQFWAASMTMLERKYPDKYGRRNEDTSVAKVIVQIGARDSDVTVITQNQTHDALSPVPRKELGE